MRGGRMNKLTSFETGEIGLRPNFIGALSDWGRTTSRNQRHPDLLTDQ
jgi:hypothetical protein